MKNRKLNLSQLQVTSFVTKIDPHRIQGGFSECCGVRLYDSDDNANNCNSFGHVTMCGSTGNTDNTTGWAEPTTPDAGCLG
ncbi:MAG: pinensin family lanthipeptide [Bacteroidota bacterium]